LREAILGDVSPRLTAVGISGSPSPTSKSRALVERALAELGARGAATQLVDLAQLPADALLGRRPAPELERALAAVAAAAIVVAGTPVYRATYSGLLKVFFDLLPQDGLTGKVGVAIATGHAPAHALATEHGLRPLFASLGAAVAPTAVYGTSDQFANGTPDRALLAQVQRAAREAAALARGLAEGGR